MDFKIDATLPATAAQLWAIFFDVQRVAGLIPGCENVTEVEPLKEFSAVMKQKIGPFKLEVPTRIVLESHTLEKQVELSATGRDKFTGTTIDVRMKVDLEEQSKAGTPACRLGVDAQMVVAGRLAALGYPVVKKRSEELFAEFEKRLRDELAQFGTSPAVTSSPQAGASLPASTPRTTKPAASAPSVLPVASASATSNAGAASGVSETVKSRPRRVELVLVWPRVGVSVAVGFAVAHVAWILGQADWWWLVAPMLGVAAGLGQRED
ncbi:CoxG family protein [Ottowia thiooxydans]|uniref:Carbon monoxide dehydrogenase subunit G n=1 Tax=Ottowia thiooxydans TaxID=219182 RepID=A0ABV2Q4H5_9BURK